MLRYYEGNEDSLCRIDATRGAIKKRVTHQSIVVIHATDSASSPWLGPGKVAEPGRRKILFSRSLVPSPFTHPLLHRTLRNAMNSSGF